MAEKISGSVSGGSGGVELPSKEELAMLPRRAMIAFAARCARRVQPLFEHYWPKAPLDHWDAVDRAITLVETSAVSPVNEGELQAAARDADDAADAAARAAADAHAADADVHDDAHDAAYATAYAAARAANVDAHAAAHDAAYAAASVAARPAVLAAMRRDFELLNAATEREQWTNRTPVPSVFFGPLWPDGEPKGWPEEQTEEPSKPHVLRVQLAVPRGMSKEQSREFNEKIKAFFVSLSEFDASMGGTGLQILENESEEPIELEDEEPVHTGRGRVEVGA